MSELKKYFLLNTDIIFLNHGSFGATPKPVFEAYQSWQLRLERQPVLFLGRELDGLLLEARIALGEYLIADADDLVYIPNATHGVNIVAHSLQIKSDDEILTTDHEYAACDYTWEFVCGKVDTKYIHQPIPLSVSTKEEIVEQFWQRVNSRTKAIYLSHMTSSTALRLPIEEICQRAKRAGILSIVDAAHSPGQIPLDLQSLEADIVFGNCHILNLRLRLHDYQDTEKWKGQANPLAQKFPIVQGVVFVGEVVSAQRGLKKGNPRSLWTLTP